VTTIQTALGYQNYLAFLSELHELDDNDLVCYNAQVISYDEDDSQDIDYYSDLDNEAKPVTIQTEPMKFDLEGLSISMDDSPVIKIDEEDQETNNDSAEFLQWHHRLGHISPKKMRIMAKEGVLPTRLASGCILLCTACLFGKATCRPWGGKIP
jgi:hypothetical protein